jgi:hypothetical protein
MKRILLGTGALALGLAALMWTTSIVRGGRGHGGGGGHAAPAHVGSVHYAAPAREAPVRAAPAARTGSVRSENYAGSRAGGNGGGSGGYGGSGGGYRNPYRDNYFNRFRPGYYPFLFDGAQYYGYYDLPVGYQTVVEDGNSYYLFDGIYYQAYIIGGQTVYLVVPDQ